MKTDEVLRSILENARTIAVVGMSTHPDKPSHSVPAELIQAGFTVIPVHPKAAQILGQRAYPTLADIPVPVDIVNIFRPSAEVADITRQALAIGAPVIWVQEDLISAEAAQIAKEAGVTYLENICIGETRQNLQVSHQQTPD